ncbi:MAG: hypothetical protein FWD26_03500 [Treponema sp.]|nr:hypothetical protein [Treponema sp.]
MKTFRIKLMIAVFAVFLLAGNLVSAAAQTVYFENNLGAEITQVIIAPSKERYPNNRNCFSANIQAGDGTVFGIEMPEHFNRYEYFDIEVVSGSKRYSTKRGILFCMEKGIPVVELGKGEKENTTGIISALAGAAGSIVFLVTTKPGRIILLETTRNLWKYGPIKWGSVAAGIVPLLAIPVASGTIGYIAGHSLTAENLNVQVVYHPHGSK